jgi:hypothetical protein
MKNLEFALYDTVWLHGANNPALKLRLLPWPRMLPDHDRAGLFAGKVIHIFKQYNTLQYVIEVDTEIEPILFVRDGLTLSNTEKGPIGMFRR